MQLDCAVQPLPVLECHAVYQPLVRAYKAPYLNPIRIEGIVGMAEAKALALLDELFEHETATLRVPPLL